MRTPLLALPLLALLAWTPLRSGDVTPPPPTEAPSPVGSWAFVMERSGGDPLSGTMVIAADGSGRFEVMRPRVDAAVRSGRLELEGSEFTWSGRAGSPLGPLAFTLRGEVAGNQMTGWSQVAGLGTVTVRATRQTES